ncbi:MAG: FAD-binding protein [Acidobacteria bacterium]|nr:FAD-binding protein [Acidobacteriota bacterium]
MNVNTVVFDVCVVGSGAAGGTLSSRLASQGLNVIVLEGGPRIDTRRAFNTHAMPYSSRTARCLSWFLVSLGSRMRALAALVARRCAGTQSPGDRGRVISRLQPRRRRRRLADRLLSPSPVLRRA